MTFLRLCPPRHRVIPNSASNRRRLTRRPHRLRSIWPLGTHRAFALGRSLQSKVELRTIRITQGRQREGARAEAVAPTSVRPKPSCDPGALQTRSESELHPACTIDTVSIRKLDRKWRSACQRRVRRVVCWSKPDHRTAAAAAAALAKLLSLQSLTQLHRWGVEATGSSRSSTPCPTATATRTARGHRRTALNPFRLDSERGA